MSIVKTDINYTYEIMMSNIYELNNKFSFLQVQNAGYSVDFSRDLSSGIYSVEKSTTFFLGEDEKLYIIYAYGNQNYTSEMDVVLFE